VCEKALNGGAERDRTADLLIANVTVIRNINNLQYRSRTERYRIKPLESTNQAQYIYERKSSPKRFCDEQ
jgi:hypothetical protein